MRSLQTAGDAIVDAVGARQAAAVQAAPAGRADPNRRLRLAKVEAGHFGGLHAHSHGPGRPGSFVFVPARDVTVLEGPNGSGKTSILNAVVWCLTGSLIRSQREPETGPTEIECETSQADGSRVGHRMSAVTPMPHAGDALPLHGAPIPAETWVELTFVDENGVALPSLRREQARRANGKLVETEPDLRAIGLDPVAWRIATVMPALLPFLPVGSPSQLGLAVAKLTGLADLVDLAKHASKAQERVSKRIAKDVAEQRAHIAVRYAQAARDLQEAMNAYPGMAADRPPRLWSTGMRPRGWRRWPSILLGIRLVPSAGTLLEGVDPCGIEVVANGAGDHGRAPLRFAPSRTRRRGMFR